MTKLYNKIKDLVLTLLKKDAIIPGSTGKFNGVFYVNGKRYFIPEHTKFYFGVGITADIKSWHNS